MIKVEDALSFASDKVGNQLPKIKEENLTDDEKIVFDYLDACIESGIYKDFCGEPFDIKVPASGASARVIAAFKSKWEEGDWLVGVFVEMDELDPNEVKQYQLVFIAPKAKIFSASSTSRNIIPKSYYERKVGEKPRVLLVSDVPNWAFDQNMKDLEKYLNKEFDFEHFYTENWFKGTRVNWDDYDIIYEAYHRNPEMGIPRDRALGAMRSQYFKPEKQGPPDAEDIALVNKYKGFQLSAKRNYDELKSSCPKAVYLTNPVDTNRFKQIDKRNEIIASWNGNAGHKSPDGRYIKHFYDIIVPACHRAKVKLVAAEYSTTNGPMRRRSFDEMPEFYQQANVALCASEYESASNSIMESMSSGLALIATDVGNHRELRDSQLASFGDTGIILVDRDVRAFASALAELTPERAYQMGEINRKEILERFSWNVWAKLYSDFLKMAL